MDGHLRNALFQDMRNFYQGFQWQNNSQDIGNSYAYKDGIPYAPFSAEPYNTTAPSVRCASCRQIQSDSYGRIHKKKSQSQMWNPYSWQDSVNKLVSNSMHGNTLRRIPCTLHLFNYSFIKEVNL